MTLTLAEPAPALVGASNVRQRRSSLVIGHLLAVLAITALLVAWKRDVLLLPGYQDQAAGYWAEADFLAKSGFDFYALRYEQNHYMDLEPGPRAYMISIVPAALAVCMLLIPDVQTLIVVVRLAGFACGAAIIWCAYCWLRGSSGRLLAATVAAALATLPLFPVQLEIMGMDVPLALLCLVSVRCLAQNRVVAASAFAAFAFAVKQAGQLATLTILAVLTAGLILGWREIGPDKRRGAWLMIGLNTLVFALEWLLTAWGDTSASILAVGNWPDMLRLPQAMINLTPDVAVVLLVASLLSLGRAFGAWRRLAGLTWRRRMFGILREQHSLVVCWVFVWGALAASLLFVYTPRYVFCAIPLLFVIVGLVASGSKAAGALVLPLMAGLIVLNLFNAEGRFFPDLRVAGASEFASRADFTPRICMLTERSDEYLADHRSNLAAARALEALPADTPIFCAVPYLTLLKSPALGYVTRPLNVIDVTMFGPAIRNFVDYYDPQRRSAEPPQPVFVYYSDSRITVPQPGPDSEILYDDGLTPALLIYRRPIPAAALRSRHDLEEWYLDQSWDERWLKVRCLGRAEYLFKTKRLERLRRELRAARAALPSDPQLLYVEKIIAEL